MYSRDHLAHHGLSGLGGILVRLVADGNIGVRAACVARIIAISFHNAANQYDATEKVQRRHTTQGLAEDLSRFAKVCSNFL